MTVSTMPAGGIDLVRGADAATVRLWGEIDAALRAEAGAALAGALQSDLPIVIDTTNVTLIDASGAAFLVQLCALGRNEGIAVHLDDPPPVVAAVLHLVGCDDVIRHTDAADRAGEPLSAG